MPTTRTFAWPVRTGKRGPLLQLEAAPATGACQGHTRDMDEKPRFSVRRNSVALTKVQWFVVAIALAVAVLGLVTALVANTSLGSMVTGVATLTAILVIGFGHSQHNDRH